jgi:DnaJ-class molecular chaperone
MPNLKCKNCEGAGELNHSPGAGAYMLRCRVCKGTGRMPPKAPKNWKCEECGKRYTLAQASRVLSTGCAAGCSGIDVYEILPAAVAP